MAMLCDDRCLYMPNAAITLQLGLISLMDFSLEAGQRCALG